MHRVRLCSCPLLLPFCCGCSFQRASTNDLQDLNGNPALNPSRLWLALGEEDAQDVATSQGKASDIGPLSHEASLGCAL